MRLAAIYISLLCEFAAMGMMLPLAPFLATKLGAGPFALSTMVAAMGVAVMVGTLVFGRLSDRYGRKPMLLATVAGSALGSVLAAVAAITGSLPGLFISRIVTGVAGGNLPIAVSMIADLTDDCDRAKYIAYLMALVAVGMVAGTGIAAVIGGPHESFNFAAVGWTSAGLSAVSAAIVVLFVGETRRARSDAEPTMRVAPSRATIYRMMILGGGLILAARITLQTAMQTSLDVILPLYLKDHLDFGAREFGFFLASVGIILIVTQVVATGPITRRIGDGGMLRLTLGAIVLGGLLAIAGTGHQWAGAAGLALMMMGLGMGQPLFHSIASKSVDPTERGTFVGAVEAVSGFGRIAGPLVAGGLYPIGTGWVAIAFVVALALGLLFWRGLSGGQRGREQRKAEAPA